VATASQELLSLDGSDFAFGTSIGEGVGFTESGAGSEGNPAFGGLAEPSDFLVVGPSEGVLSKFAMLFQWSDISKVFSRGRGSNKK